MAAPFVVAGALSAGASLLGGIFGNKAARKEARLREQQSRLAFEDALQEADRVATEVRKFRSTQSLAFVKSGVTLAGSPLLVTEETQREGEKEVKAIRRRGAKELELGRQGASILRSQGRAALLGGILGAAGGGLKDIFTARAMK